MFCEKLSRIADFLDTSYCGKDVLVQSIAYDSRTIAKDNLYIPLIGKHADGHDFIQNVEHIASATLWQKDHTPYPNIPFILVDDTVLALQTLARRYAQSLSTTYIGITGSNGKTSTKDILLALLSSKYKTQATIGNQNNELGLPMTLLNLDRDTEFSILEMGLEYPGDIAFLASFVPLSAGIITSIGKAHLETMKSYENIIQGKCEIIPHIVDQGPFLYPSTPTQIEKYLSPRLKNIQVSLDDVEIITMDQFGSTFKTPAFGSLHLPLIGKFQIQNALNALIIANHFGITDFQSGLDHISLTANRFHLEHYGNATILNDVYKSNPDSCLAAFDSLSMFCGKKYAILSDMLDLGKDSIQFHTQIGQIARQLGIEIFCYGTQSQAYQGHWFANQDDLIKAVIPFLKEDCTILVKGSRAMKMERIIQAFQEVNL